MSTLYLTQQDAVLRKEDERLRVTLKGETLLDLPMLKVSEVVVMGRVTVTPHTVAALMERNVHLTYLTEHGRYIGRIEPAFSKNSLLRRAQYAASFDSHRTLSLARGFVLGKLANLRVTLLRAARNTEGLNVDDAVEAIRGAERRAERAEDLDILRGHEGEGSAAYFGAFGHLIKAEGFSFAKRVRRPPTDPVNALLSFGYALLANNVHAAGQALGFDPYCGYLHADRYGRPSLALDLMEEFRPLVVDATVLACLNKRIIQPDDFSVSLGDVCSLTPDARKKFLIQYEERKQTEIQHPLFRLQGDLSALLRAAGADSGQMYSGRTGAIRTVRGTVMLLASSEELMSMKGEFTAVFEKQGKWYVAYVEEVPGVNTQGRTLKEARENLKEALVLVLEANRALAEKNRAHAKVRKETLTVELSRDVA